MRELLLDMSLLHELEAIHGCTPFHTLGPARPRFWEVTLVYIWCYCFLDYTAIVTSDMGPTRLCMPYKCSTMEGPVGSITIGSSANKLPQTPLYGGIPYSQDYTWPLLSGKDLHRGHPLVCSAREVDYTRTQCALAYLHPPVTRRVTSPIVATRRRQFNVYPGTRADASSQAPVFTDSNMSADTKGNRLSTGSRHIPFCLTTECTGRYGPLTC